MTSTKDQLTTLQPTHFEACTHASVRRTMRVISHLYDTTLRSSGVKTTQFTLLAALSYCGPIPLTKLADILILDRTSLSRNLQPLIEKGWINIEQEKDERVRIITITPKGLDILSQTTPLWRKAQTELIQSFGQEPLKRLMQDLTELTDTIRKL